MAVEVGNYGYNAKLGRYVNLTTGRIVATDDIRDVVTESMMGFFRNTDGLGLGLANGTVDLEEFQLEMIRAIRNSNEAMYILGRGGVNNLILADYEAMGNKVEEELGFLDGFMADIAQGNLTVSQIQARVSLYAESSWNAYHIGEQTQNQAAGFNETRRIAVDDGGTCSDCADYAAQGWQPLGKLPLPGKGSVCRSRCRCYVEYRVGQKKGRVRL